MKVSVLLTCIPSCVDIHDLGIQRMLVKDHKGPQCSDLPRAVIAFVSVAAVGSKGYFIVWCQPKWVIHCGKS